jgi:hypothetical protein
VKKKKAPRLGFLEDGMEEEEEEKDKEEEAEEALPFTRQSKAAARRELYQHFLRDLNTDTKTFGGKKPLPTHPPQPTNLNPPTPFQASTGWTVMLSSTSVARPCFAKNPNSPPSSLPSTLVLCVGCGWSYPRPPTACKRPSLPPWPIQ